jgi:hypothetical protein
MKLGIFEFYLLRAVQSYIFKVFQVNTEQQNYRPSHFFMFGKLEKIVKRLAILSIQHQIEMEIHVQRIMYSKNISWNPSTPFYPFSYTNPSLTVETICADRKILLTLARI